MVLSLPGAKVLRSESSIIHGLRCGNNHLEVLEVLEGLGLIMLRRHLNSTAGETVGPTDNAVVDRTCRR